MIDQSNCNEQDVSSDVKPHDYLIGLQLIPTREDRLGHAVIKSTTVIM